MKYLDEFRNKKLIEPLAAAIKEEAGGKPFNFMEVCGTHTVAIFRSGIRSMLPDKINLISGPGCPVCVTPASYMDKAIALCGLKDTAIVTFGDMFRVPGSTSSLEKEKAKGKDVRIAYSPYQAIEFSQKEPDKNFIFLAVGFETTIPTIAYCAKEAKRLRFKNLSFLSGNKVVPPALKALADDSQIKLDGLMLPGHVSTIIGREPYLFLSKKYKINGAICGFEAVDILRGILSLVRMAKAKTPDILIEYTRSVKESGNKKAIRLIKEVFEPEDTEWRGLGVIPKSGLRLKKEFKALDADKRFSIKIKKPKVFPGCVCGDIIKGIKTPLECGLFAKACTPAEPIGPCMVSSEGTCAAYYKYGREKHTS